MIDVSNLVIPEPTPEAFRRAGWMVAVHNDYKLYGMPFTFWLWTHPLGVWVKGEGETDTIALQAAMRAVENLKNR